MLRHSRLRDVRFRSAKLPDRLPVARRSCSYKPSAGRIRECHEHFTIRHDAYWWKLSNVWQGPGVVPDLFHEVTGW